MGGYTDEEDNMKRFSFCAPVVPGKEPVIREMTSLLKGDLRADFIRSRKAAGVATERVFLQTTPKGQVIVLVWDTERPVKQVFAHYATSTDAFDKRFAGFLSDVHDIDITETSKEPQPECLIDWTDSSWTLGSGQSWGMAIPLKQGVASEFRAAILDMYGDGGDEWTQWRRASGLCHTTICLQSTPIGDFALIYLEGNDIKAAMAHVRDSDTKMSARWRELAPKLYAIDVTNAANVPQVEHLLTIEAFQPAVTR